MKVYNIVLSIMSISISTLVTIIGFRESVLCGLGWLALTINVLIGLIVEILVTED